MTSPEQLDLVELADLAERLARQAGELVVEMRTEAVRSATTKSTPTDPVTAGDKASEAVVVEGLLEARPADGLVGEEGANRSGTSGIDWLIDPIDGTVNYLYGIPAYSVSIAARGPEGTMLVGVVFNPVTDELFRAEAGNGATLNGAPIGVTEATELESTLVGTGFSYSKVRRQAQAKVVVDLLGSVRDIRRAGSAALDICSVACGRLDAYYEGGLNAWDYGAGWLVATEAGARCDDLRGGPLDSRFAFVSSPGVHGELGDLLRRLDADELPES